MKMRTTYFGVKRIEYEFNEYDIKEALMAHFGVYEKIKKSRLPAHELDFNVWVQNEADENSRARRFASTA